ncbi:MAG TPA: hypothetical protein VNB24_04485 [Acidimicrobiales bacterium]|nr:hypothetical protein [Acidimicrobiales bacterium]
MTTDPAYRALAMELAALPRRVQEAAYPMGNGELEWPIAIAGSAVEALRAAQRLVLGLAIRDYALDGSFTEVAWTFEATDDPQAACEAALGALRRHEGVPFERVVVRWRYGA